MNKECGPLKRPVRILLVEDAPEQVRLMQEALDSAMIDRWMDVALSGEEALRFLMQKGSNPPDIVILDLNLPGKSGHEVLREVKTNRETACIPVIVLSSSRHEGDVTRAYACHANCYIAKPNGFDELVDVVRSMATFWFQLVRLPSPV